MAEHVLIVEADRLEVVEISGFLSANGYRVSTCFSAQEASGALDRRRFDALILSARLPDADGFEVCRQVRTWSDIALLMLTPAGQEIDRIVGLEIGADDCLGKPVNLRELLARLRAVTRRRRSSDPSTEPPLEFGRLRIDRRERVVRLDGVEKPLTDYQFALLLALAKNAGRVLSRAELLDLLKRGDGAGFDRSIDVQVCRVRSLIEDDPSSPRRLTTIRGTGYLFEREQDAPA